jgi:hypothetical protein
MHAAMGQFNVGQGRWGGLSALQGHVQPGDQQAVFDGAEALRAFGVPCAHLVFPAGGVCEITCRAHTACLPAYQPGAGAVGFLENFKFAGFSLSRPRHASLDGLRGLH